MFKVIALSLACVAGILLPCLPKAEAKTQGGSREIDTAISGRHFDKDLTYRFFRSVHIVRRLAEFDIATLKTREDGGAWIVAEIIPGGLSGGLYLPNEGAQPLVQFGGQWKLLETIDGEGPPAEGRYQWKTPHVERSFDRSVGMHDGASVFVGEGSNPTVICQFFKESQGEQQFRAVTPIPDDWKALVKPALDSIDEISGVLAGDDADALRKLATGKNPFLAVSALRQLLAISKSAEERDKSLALLLTLPKFRQAQFTYWALKADDEDLRKRILAAIDHATTTEELSGIALGIESWTATLGRPVPPFVRDFYVGVGNKWHNLDPSVPRDDSGYTIWWRFVTGPGNPEPASDKAEH